MPKLNRFNIEIETGETGTDLPVHFTINNHKMPLEDTRGGVGPAENFSGGFEIGSFAHSLTLVGPVIVEFAGVAQSTCISKISRTSLKGSAGPPWTSSSL